jgi:hypothetical protein
MTLMWGPAGEAEVLAAATTDAIPDFNLDWDVPLENEAPQSDDLAPTLEGGVALPEEEALPPVVDPLSVLDDASGSDWAGTPESDALPQPDVLELDLADFNFDFPDAAAPAVADLPPESGQADEVLPLADVHAVPPAVADRTADLDFDLDFGESPTGATVPVADDQFEPDTSESVMRLHSTSRWLHPKPCSRLNRNRCRWALTPMTIPRSLVLCALGSSCSMCT